MTLLQSLSSGWKAWLLLALITFSAAAPGVWSIPALDRDESRFAQASKQMLETGDFVTIRYQDEYRNKKPAGIHWMQAATTAVFSSAEAKEIWSYRLPSLIGAVLAVLATFWCGRILVGQRAAFLGAALFGSGILLTSEAHIAKTDGMLVFLTATAMGALARIYMASREGPQRRWDLLFWLATATSFLIKGPVTLLVAGLTFGLISIVRRDASWARPLVQWQGLGLFAVLVLPWFVWIQIVTSGAYIEGAVGKDLADKLFTASEGHGGPPGYHLLFLATHFFPATLFLIPGIVLLVRTLRGRTLETVAEERAGLIFLACWLFLTWIFFELLPTKLSHYILPAYPALALVCGWCIVKLMSGMRMPLSRGLSAGLFIVTAASLSLVMSPWGLSYLQAEAAHDFTTVSESTVLASWLAYANMNIAWLAMGGLAALATLIAFIIRQWGASVALGVLTSIFLGWHIRAEAIPNAVWTQPTVAARMALADVCAIGDDNAEGCPDTPRHGVRAVGYAEPSLVFTTGTEVSIPPYTRVELPTEPSAYPLTYLLNLEDPAGVSARETLMARAEGEGRCATLSDPVYALNYSNGDPVHFVAIRFHDGPCATALLRRN
ncbi:MAG: glycosyltransferase family 39 protein [Pseudomonadota bacterium]